MARYIYEWKPTQHGRRLFRRPGRAARTAAPAPEPTSYSGMLKPELVETAENLGIDSSGTKADIIERLQTEAGSDE